MTRLLLRGMKAEGFLSVLILLFSWWSVGSLSHPTDGTGSSNGHEKRASGGSTFLVGVGKADITG